MRERHKVFADEYLIDLNATRAYMVAYSETVKSEKAAGTNGNKLLKRADVRAYLEQRLSATASSRVARAEEVLEYLTKVMRRELKENVVVTTTNERSSYEPDENGTMRKRSVREEAPQVVEIPAKLSDANRAAELLGKRYALFTDKTEISGEVVVFEGEKDIED